MSDLSLIPLQDGYESQLSQDWDGATGTVYVLATPSYTPTTTNTYIVVNPGKTNMQIAEITDYDSTAKTLTVSSISFEKGLGISSTAQSHSTGSKVIISDNYQFWEDIQTAINTKLDDTGGTMTGLLQFTGTTHAGIKLLSLTTAQRDALSASNGMIIYNSTTGELNQYIGGAWSAVAAGSTQPTASTTVLGKIKTDVTPAGDPVALIADNPKYDALAGTSGTPSTSNKYVTNDDTATAATASKVARRLAGGNITVVTETTGNSTTNAASTAFVQQEITANAGVTIYPNVPNVGVIATTYFTHSMRVDADLGWTVTGTPTLQGNWQYINAATNTRFTIPLGGRASGAHAESSNLQWNSGIDFKMAYLFTTDETSAGTTPAGAGDIWYWHGFTTAATATSTVADITDVSRRAGFSHYNGRIYAVTANGTNVQTTDIQADVGSTKTHFMIFFTATSITYYINGVLVATHTTYPPNDANDIYANFGGYDGSAGAACDFGMSADIIFSETII